MAENICLQTGQFSSRSLKASLSNLKDAENSLAALDSYGAMANARYECNGKNLLLYGPDLAAEASSIARQIEKLRSRMEAYAKLLDSAPEALEAVDSSCKGMFTDAWQRIWNSISNWISTTSDTAAGFWNSLFHKGGNKTGDVNGVSDNDSNDTSQNDIEESLQRTVNSSPTYKYWGITEAEIEEIVKASTSEEDAQQKLAQALKEKLNDAVANGHRTDTSNYSEKTKYSYYDWDGIFREDWGAYEITGGCTWYAFNRFREMNNRDLVFHGAGGGNAQDWDDRIDTTQFEKINTSDNCNGITNAIAVDNEGSPINGVYYGHVSYVEAIIGDTVYMSEGWYKDGTFHQSGLKAVSLVDFSNEYETLIVVK